MSISPSVGALSKYLSEIKLVGAWQQSKGAYDRRSSASRSSGHRLLEMSRAAPPVGRARSRSRASCSRTWGSPTSASCPATTCRRSRRRSAARSRSTGRSSSTSGPRRGRATARRGGPGLVPRRGAAADGARADRPTRTTGMPAPRPAPRRVRSPSSARSMADRRGDAPSQRRAADGDAAAPPTRRPRTAEEAAQLHGALRDGAGRAGRRGPADRRRSPRACPPAPASSKFQAAFPDRFIDVGIAEQHAVTLATGLALGGHAPGRRAVLDVPPAGLRPDRPRRLPERRAGAARGRPRRASWARTGRATRACSRSRPSGQLPNLVDREPARTSRSSGRCVRTALAQDHPFALHYPRDAGFGVPGARAARCSRSGAARCSARAATCCSSRFGPITQRALEVADALEAEGWSVGVVNARFAKPLDRQLILDAGARQAARRHVRGERGDRRVRLGRPRGDRGGAARRPGVPRASPVRIIGIPGDRFVDHGSVTDLRRLIRLDVPGLTEQVERGRSRSSGSRRGPSARADPGRRRRGARRYVRGEPPVPR